MAKRVEKKTQTGTTVVFLFLVYFGLFMAMVLGHFSLYQYTNRVFRVLNIFEPQLYSVPVEWC